MNKTSPMRRIYNSRVFWLVVSLFAAVALWMYIIGVETDEGETTFRNVPVQFVGDDVLRNSRNLVITDLDTNSVSVTVRGPRRILSSLSASDLVAQVDVSRLNRSAYTSQQVTVVFPDNVASSLTVQRRTPESVNFMVSNLTKKDIPVRGGFAGTLDEGFTAESPAFEPSVITVYGSEAYLKEIDRAWVTFGQDMEVSGTYEVETGFTLLNVDGEPCSYENLTFSTDTVIATLPVLEVKQVALGVDLIEGAGAMQSNTKVVVEPQYITLAGDSAILSGLNRIILDTIDLTDFASTFTETYTIPIDNELRNVTGVTEATVTIEIYVGLETRSFSVTNLSFINLTEGLEAELLTETIDVVLRGTPEQLDSIKSEQIRAVADLTDYVDATGTYMVPVRIRVDGDTGVGAIGETGVYTISMEIRKAK